MKSRSFANLSAACMLLSVCLVCGCGSQLGADVSGTVTNNGQPLGLGTVAFHPTTSGTTAYGAIQTDGSYRVKTGSQQGLPPGDYLVTVVAREPNTQRSEGGGPPEPGKLLTDAKYAQKNTSELRYTVAKGKNEFSIELTSK